MSKQLRRTPQKSKHVRCQAPKEPKISARSSVHPRMKLANIQHAFMVLVLGGVIVPYEKNPQNMIRKRF